MTDKITSKHAHFSMHLAENGVAWLKMDVQGKTMNVLRTCFINEINEILNQIEEKKEVKGLVFYSAKPDNFIVGADVRMLDDCTSAEHAHWISEQGQRLFSRIEALPFHVVAAIHGACLGGGLELALACHSRVATEDEKTQLGLPEIKLGLLPGSGGTQRLPRLIGLACALDMILSGTSLRAKQAKRKGLVNELVPHSIYLRVAEQLALKAKPKKKTHLFDWLMVKNSLLRAVVFNQAAKKVHKKTRGNYPAALIALEVIKQGIQYGMAEGLEREAHCFSRLVITPESAALRRLFLLSTEIRKEKVVEAPAVEVKGVAIMGGGLMGAGIANVTANQAKLPVRIKDVNQDGLLNALNYNYTLLHQKYKRGMITASQWYEQMSRISATTNAKGMSRCNLVIEAVFEDLALKLKLVAEIESTLSENTFFATNTSSIPIYQVAKGAKRPENIVGLHYFSPVEKMPLVEVIPHAGTSDTTLATVLALAKKQGKTPIVVADKAGFYVNRILAPLLNEAALILQAGESIERIETAFLDFGFPVGPMTLLDEVGIDVASKISPILMTELGGRFKAPDLFDLMLADGRKGKKSGKGFFLYKGKTKKVDKNIYRLLQIKVAPYLNGHEIALRCVLMLLNEAVRCLDENVIHSARDGDIGAVFGIGFPPFLGGPFCYMDYLGLARVIELLEDHEAKYGERFAPCKRLKVMAANNRCFLKENVQ